MLIKRKKKRKRTVITVPKRKAQGKDGSVFRSRGDLVYRKPQPLRFLAWDQEAASYSLAAASRRVMFLVTSQPNRLVLNYDVSNYPASRGDKQAEMGKKKAHMCSHQYLICQIDYRCEDKKVCESRGDIDALDWSSLPFSKKKKKDHHPQKKNRSAKRCNWRYRF